MIPDNDHLGGGSATGAAAEPAAEGADTDDSASGNGQASSTNLLAELDAMSPSTSRNFDEDAECGQHVGTTTTKPGAVFFNTPSGCNGQPFDDSSDYINELPAGRDWPSWPTPPCAEQLHNRALLLWHVRRSEETTAQWKQLADDLLEGRIDEIPAHHATRIEDLLTKRVRFFWPDISSFLAACWWAQHGMPVFPQQPSKAPLIRSPHPRGSRERVMCKRACGQDGHGHLDATTDLDHIRSWARDYGLGWGGLAGRLPEGLIDIEDDPRHGGDVHIRQLQDTYGPLPQTLEIISGRGDGGRHRIFSVPTDLKLDGHRLRGTGVDFKDHNSAVRLPPSCHHVNFQPYRLVSRPIAPAPGWLLALLLADPKHKEPFAASAAKTQDSVADWFCETASWQDLLTTHDWLCVAGDGDSDGSRWRHPNATSDSSASIAHGCLFVFSPNTEFEPTDFGDTHGYTLFRAYAVLEHNGDMKAAAKVLRDEKKAGIW